MNKIKMVYFVLLILSFLYLVGVSTRREEKSEILAQENPYKTTKCSVSFSQTGAPSVPYKAVAVRGLQGILSLMSSDAAFNRIDLSKYEAFISYNRSWYSASLTKYLGALTIVSLNGVAFPETKNYGISAYVSPKSGVSGESFYCSNTEVWVYDLETPVTSGGWIGQIQTAPYESPAVRSATGKMIGQVRYTVSGCEENDPLMFCPMHSFVPNGYGDQSIIPGTTTSRIVFALSEQSEVRFHLEPAGVGTSLATKAKIALINDITLWVRNFGGNVPPPPPPVPTATSTPTPTPVPGAVCDPNCGAGACGVRLPSGACVADWGNSIYRLNCCALNCVPPGAGGSCLWVAPCPGGNCSWACQLCAPSPTPTPTTIPSTPTPTSPPRNQICDVDSDTKQPIFTNRQVVFEVTLSDEDGGATITEVRMRFRLGTDDYLVVRSKDLDTNPTANKWGLSSDLASLTVSTSVAGNNRTVVFTITFDENFPEAIYEIGVWGSDGITNTGWRDTGRDFKVWDCKVPVSGTMYDSGGTFNCATSFSTSVSSTANFLSLTFEGLGTPDKETDVNSPNYANKANNELIWGQQYGWSFNPDINTFNINARTGGEVCLSGLSVTLNGATVDPYDDDPSLRLDFSGEMIYGSWYQAIGGGILARTGITDEVPPTCSGNCHPAMSIGMTTALGVGESNNGIVGARTVSNPSGCGESCDYGWPSNWQTSRDMLGRSYSYDGFINSYWAKLGVGWTYGGNTTMQAIVSDAGGTGVVFVRGNLNIATNNSLGSNQFLMVIVDGNITIDSGVNRVEGVLAADGNITASGESDSQLKISGMLYAGGDINLERSYATEVTNNTNPAVVVDYRPGLIFNMPSKLIKTVSVWREGP